MKRVTVIYFVHIVSLELRNIKKQLTRYLNQIFLCTQSLSKILITLNLGILVILLMKDN